MRSRVITLFLVCAALVVYFAYHLTYGDHGLRARTQLKLDLVALEGEVSGLRAVRGKLEHDVSLLRAEKLDPDMLDERARAILNFAHPHDLVIVSPKNVTGSTR